MVKSLRVYPKEDASKYSYDGAFGAMFEAVTRVAYSSTGFRTARVCCGCSSPSVLGACLHFAVGVGAPAEGTQKDCHTGVFNRVLTPPTFCGALPSFLSRESTAKIRTGGIAAVTGAADASRSLRAQRSHKGLTPPPRKRSQQTTAKKTRAMTKKG